MATIKVPKPFTQLIQEIKDLQIRDPKLVIDLMGKYKATDAKGRYLHWHEFKWRVQAGDDEVIAWITTKLSRRLIAKILPLRIFDQKEFIFHYCVPDSLFAQLYLIEQRIRHISQISDDKFLSTREKNHYLIKSLIQEEAITSAQLEGASTTREIAKEMLQKNLPAKDKSQKMILNNYLLMQKVIEHKNDELSIEFILELHQIATRDVIENNVVPGELRNHNNIFVSDCYEDNVFYPPDHETLKYRLMDLCKFANEHHSTQSNFIHPIIKAIILHFMIAYIHPFSDGNGRTARAIFYWSVLRSGYWLFEYVSISKLIQEKRSAYDKAFLYTETDEFDLTYFIYNQVDTIEKAINSLHKYLDSKRQDFHEFLDWIEQSPIAKYLKRGELEILKEAMKKPGTEFMAKQVAVNLGTTENTARSYLNRLADQDLLLRTKSRSDKTVLYVSPANLKGRLKL